MGKDAGVSLTGSNLNTILLSVCIGLLGWMAITTHNTSNSLSGMQSEVSNLIRQSPDNIQRHEYDVKMIAIEGRLAEFAIRIREIDLQLIKLQVKSSTP